MGKIDAVKQFCIAGDLAKANEKLNELIRSKEFQLTANSRIVVDHSFYEQQLAQFVMTITDDQHDNADKEETEFEAILGKTFFERYVHTYDDILVHAFHVASHNKCAELWKKCPVMMDSLEQCAVFMLEEIYNQRLVSIVAPDLHHMFCVVAIQYDELNNRRVEYARLQMQSLFAVQNFYLDDKVDFLHRWLYGCHPLHQQVFDIFVESFKGLMQNSAFAERVRQY